MTDRHDMEAAKTALAASAHPDGFEMDYVYVTGDTTEELFGLILLDGQNRLVEYLEPFRGTVNQSAVYPREVVKLALAKNAQSVMLVHNHPSGAREASRADIALTKHLKDALALVDVRVLDHFIVAGATVVSMAEAGLL
mgnify:CR=1 FL=1